MLLLKIFLIRNFYRIVWPVRMLYWYIVRPQKRGVKCLVQYQDKFLLVRIAYASSKLKGRWTMPGGAVNKKESPDTAAKREVKEEVGIGLDYVHKIYEYDTIIEFKKDHVSCFYSRVENDHFKIDPVEISEARWFKKSELPDFRHEKIDLLISLSEHDQH